MQLKVNPQKWILVVDDEPEVRHTMQGVIENHFGDKARVVQAENGIEATSKINCQSFDCIITDLRMPKKEGQAFISSVRRNILNESTPVIVLSGIENGKRVADHFKFVYFVSKPCEFDQVTQLLEVQLSIGQTNRRVSADLLNNFLVVTNNYVEKTTGLETKLFDKIRSKDSKELVLDNCIGTLAISIDSLTNYFSIYFDLKNLTKLRSLNSKENLVGDKGIEEMFCHAILSRVVRREKQRSNAKIKASIVNLDFQMIRQNSGILIDIGNKSLQLSVFSSSK